MRFHLFLRSALVLVSAGTSFVQATTVAPDPSKQQSPAAEAVAPSPQSITTNSPADAVTITPAPNVSAVVTPSATDHHLTANRFVLATSIANHEPQGTKEQFCIHDGHVFAFADLSSKGNDHVTFHWKKDGKTYYEGKVSIKDSPRWRTYSKVIAHPGNWSVELVDSHGTVIKKTSFVVIKDDPHISTDSKALSPLSESAQKKPTSVKEVLQALEPAKGEKVAK